MNSTSTSFGGSFSTMQTGCLTGGVKRSSGVNVLSNVSENWSKVRDDGLPNTDWLICGFLEGSKTDVTTLFIGGGGVEALSNALKPNTPAYGGFRLRSNGRFVTFFHVGDETTSSLLKGRVCLYKQAVFNIFQGSDCEVTVLPNVTTEYDVMMQLMDKIPSTKHTGHMKRRPQEQTVARPAAAGAVKPAPRNHNFQPNSASVAKTTTTSSVRKTPMYYPYESLKNISDSSPLPSGVDPCHREQSLTAQEFIQVFGVDQPTFAKLPKWKQNQLKKNVHLF